MTEFRVAFEAISHLPLATLAERVYAKFDGILAERDGRISIAVYLEGSDACEVAKRAIESLEKCDLSVVRVDPDLVDGPEIASRLGVSRQAVNLWARGNRGNSFPHPVGSPGGKRIWAWGQITAWAQSNRDGFDEPRALDQDETALVDAFLAKRRFHAQGHSERVLTLTVGGGRAKSHFQGFADASDYRVKEMHAAGAGSA